MKLDIIVKTTKGGIKIPDQHRPAFDKLIEFCNKKRAGYVRVQISQPFKHRTTGDKSQNHAINGFISQIASETGDDFDYLKETIKRRAIKRGYPFRTSKLGEAIPYSETEISTKEAAHFIDEIKEVAAFLDIILKGV